MPRKHPTTTRRHYYTCFLCGEVFCHQTMPRTVVLDRNVCWMCMKAHPTTRGLEGAIWDAAARRKIEKDSEE